MEYRYLGNSGLRVSAISLGSMNFGATTSEATARQMVNFARDKGVNFIDSADAYVGGKAEVITGKLIKKDRADWVLATKVGQQDGPPERKMGLSKKWMMEAIDNSLTRLGTDYVDIYYMHHVDWATPLEESISAMGEIIASGKAQYWGFSNHRAWQIGELAHLCDRLGCPRPIIAQPLYNMVNRQVEADLLPACEYYGIGVTPYSALARGVLTGKYAFGKDAPSNSRAGRGDPSILSRDFQKESFQVVEKIKKYIAKRNMTPSDFAVNWLLNNQLVTSVIGGPRTMGHWRASVNAIKHDFTAEDEAFVNTLVAPGHPATPGHTWGRYPVQGRRAING
ncbi:MAG: aldo/keto reductase [Rhodospirillaceae bacterium]|nr:aldo/keto reductase [Rhodospirillales bacterium]MBT3904613.1 aldo/keto reductase [Rhodospirillaceae bacterium]MBT4700688.1 aldo/keto reductase [Rhodospirillaceae bacterium]MBT5032894.1 aldo/keto reductase [Rhodospirillaceae bacterium]MBT6221421.1 aldo/keto reductase [Rhodospirillaceae bacterium]